MSASPAAEVVGAFADALQREAHVLVTEPDLLWQQLHNRLQWAGGAVEVRLAPERDRRSRAGSRPWMRTRTRAAERGDLVRVLEARAGEKLENCAIAPDGAFVVSAGSNGALQVWDWQSGARLAVGAGERPPDSVAALDGLRALEGVLGSMARSDTRQPVGATWRSGLRSCAVSAGGLVAYGDEDGLVRLWDPMRGEPERVVGQHGSAVNACAFSPDGAYIATAGEDKTLHVWSVKDAAPVQSFGHGRAVRDCAFGPDGATLVSCSLDRTVRVWDVFGRREPMVLRGHSDVVPACAISPDGTHIASASWDRTVRLWDTRDGTLVATLEGHTDWVTACAFSPDGSVLASGSRDKTVRLWDLAELVPRTVLAGHTSQITACRYTPDGSALLSSSIDGTIRVWRPNPQPGAASYIVRHREGIAGCAFDATGAVAASASRDGTIKLWDAATGECLQTLSATAGAFHACAIAPDGAVYGAADDGSLRIWPAGAGDGEATRIVAHAGPVYDCALSADATRLATSSHDGTVKIWGRDALHEELTLEGHRGAVFGCAFSGDQSLVVSTGEDTTVRLWDARTGRCQAELHGHGSWVLDGAGNRDASCVVSVDADGRLLVWSGQPLDATRDLHAHDGTAYACLLVDEQRVVLSAGTDHRVRVWDLDRGVQLATLPLPGDGECLARHPHRLTVACGERGGSLLLIDLIGFDADRHGTKEET